MFTNNWWKYLMSLNLKPDMIEQRTIGILSETKSPPDSRVVLPPSLCREAMQLHPSLKIIVQSSPSRCFADDEYREEGIEVVGDVSFCDILLSSVVAVTVLLTAGISLPISMDPVINVWNLPSDAPT